MTTLTEPRLKPKHRKPSDVQRPLQLGALHMDEPLIPLSSETLDAARRYVQRHQPQHAAELLALLALEPAQ